MERTVESHWKLLISAKNGAFIGQTINNKRCYWPNGELQRSVCVLLNLIIPKASLLDCDCSRFSLISNSRVRTAGVRCAVQYTVWKSFLLKVAQCGIGLNGMHMPAFSRSQAQKMEKMVCKLIAVSNAHARRCTLWIQVQLEFVLISNNFGSINALIKRVYYSLKLGIFFNLLNCSFKWSICSPSVDVFNLVCSANFARPLWYSPPILSVSKLWFLIKKTTQSSNWPGLAGPFYLFSI